MKQRQWWHVNAAGKVKAPTPGQLVCEELKRVESDAVKVSDASYRNSLYVLKKIKKTNRALYRRIESGEVPFVPHETEPHEKRWRALRQKKSRALTLAGKAQAAAVKGATGKRLAILIAKEQRYRLQAAECDRLIDAEVKERPYRPVVIKAQKAKDSAWGKYQDSVKRGEALISKAQRGRRKRGEALKPR